MGLVMNWSEGKSYHERKHDVEFRNEFRILFFSLTYAFMHVRYISRNDMELNKNCGLYNENHSLVLCVAN